VKGGGGWWCGGGVVSDFAAITKTQNVTIRYLL
jgi:hypothetical protein